MAGKRTLGLDIGSNSIGWALIETGGDGGRIIATGARVFPEGVDRDQQGGELSKNASRRIARGMRRQIARRARRKRKLRDALVHVGLYPADYSAQLALEGLNPYELRRRALSEQLEPFEIGRVLLHLNQRRGFLSNRKADRQKKAEDSKMLAEISTLAKQIGDAGHATLGEHLAAKQWSAPLERLRGKHTHRSMLDDEFEKIWESQRHFHPQLLYDDLKYGRRGRQSYPRKPERIGKAGAAAVAEVGLHGLIFFQRPMYWPKSVIGQCEFDPKQKRCPRADRAAQRFRILQEVNNLRIIRGDGEICELSDSQRDALLKMLAQNGEVPFDKIRKQLGLLENDAFNLEAGDRRKLLGMKTDAMLAKKDFYGKAWHALTEDRKTAIVRLLIAPEKDDGIISRQLVDEFGIDADVAERMLDAPLPEGYASLGRETIERLLPFLEQRLPLVSRDGTPSAARLAAFLAPWERPLPKGKFLPRPPEITNPLVRQALFEVRKLMNAIVREYGKPDAIHVELTREVKGSAEQRSKRTRGMRENERQRERIAAILEEHGEKPTRSKIELYRLWEEQRQVCIYSYPGREISIRQLLGGEVNVDHILPYSRSLDDSLTNLAVCFRDENESKGNQTPYEWLAATAPEKYEQVLLRASKLPYAKRARFSQKSCELEEFINRQLSDTAYITNVVLDYLRHLDVDLLGLKGQLTAELRHEWGLNKVLRHDDVNRKNRDDHRHHAVDAIVLALTDRSRLQQLARRRSAYAIAHPWPTFRSDVEAAVNAIYVSHRVRRKVSGALHNETVYGPTETEGEFVYRKPLESLTAAMVPLIRDDVIRRIVIERLRKFGIILDGDGAKREKKAIPKEVWKEPLRMPSGVVIKKVRLLENDKTITPLRGAEQFVKPNANHHLCIFAITDEKGREKRVANWVNMIEAAKRVRTGEPLIQRTHPDHPSARFLMSISQGEMLLAEFAGSQKLVRFKTGASTSGQLWFLEHTDARRDSKPFSAMPNTLKARKVTVDLLGRLRWAND